MQPYFFPYIGYYQLISSVDHFVFYDDVNYIKNGWINRNRILINGLSSYLTVSCIKASSHKKINEVEFDPAAPRNKTLLKTISNAYRNAPYYEAIFPLVKKVLLTETTKISTLAMESVCAISKHLGIDTTFSTSSECFPHMREMGRIGRLLSICKNIGASQYINPLGGKELYSKPDFLKEGIQLYFIEPEIAEYKQFENPFIPGLSIIDILMFNSTDEVKSMLEGYKLL